MFWNPLTTTNVPHAKQAVCRWNKEEEAAEEEEVEQQAVQSPPLSFRGRRPSPLPGEYL